MTIKSESNNSTPSSTPPSTPVLNKEILKTPLLNRVRRAESFEGGVTDSKFIIKSR